MILLLIDVKQRRPSCVLLQAMFGGDSHIVSSLFPIESWLTVPNNDMRLIEGTLEQWKAFAQEVGTVTAHV